MTKKRYYEKEYGEEYYIFDSEIITEKEVEEKIDYEGYKAFEDSLTGEEIVDLLNNNEKLNRTIQELYQFRLLYNAHLFNEWAENGKYEVYKSRKHDTGDVCFDGEWFIVVAILPTGQISNHYHIKDWDLFKIPSFDKVKDKFDGHTSTDVLDRLKNSL